jgi:hemerythrin-like domain-containing protein
MIEFFALGEVDEFFGRIIGLFHDQTRINNLAKNITKFTEEYNRPDQSEKYARLVSQLAEGK